MIEKVKEFLRGWRTIIAAFLLALASSMMTIYDTLIASGVDVQDLISDRVPTKYVGIAGIVIALVFGGLRFVTTTAMFSRSPKAE